MNEIINSSDAPQPIGPYSQAILANGKILFVSEQIGLNYEGILAEGIENQTKQVLENIKAILKAASLDFKNIVRTTLFLKNMTDFVLVNSIYSEYFNVSKPARTTVEVSNLPKGALIGIDAIAIID